MNLEVNFKVKLLMKMLISLINNSGTDVYIHTCRSYVHTPRDHVFGSQRIIVVNVVAVVARWPILPILGFWGSKVYTNGRFTALDAEKTLCKI